ncbi:MAG: hypothetical protein ACO329_10790, partial [Steroidobacteraceae bacterium]
MPLTINTNIASIQSERALAANRGNMETAMQRLSSGKRINSALDDASGLAVANRMRNQIEGLNMAIRNASDGISLAQTAEGAMEELQNVLLRMRELAVQASNGTYTDTDRSYIAAEFDELMKELRRVSNQAAWDQDIKLIAEGAKSQQVQVGIEAADYIEIPLRSLTVEDLNLAAKKGVDSATGVAIESFKFHQYSNNAEPAVAFVPASVTASDGTATAAKSSLTDVQFIDSPLPNFELRLWNGARDADGNPEGIDSAVNVLSVSGAASVQDLITRLKAHPNYDATSVDIKFEAGELKLVWKIAGQPDPASSLVVTNPVDKGAAVAIAEGTLNKTFSASTLITPPGDATDYPDYYQQDFDLSDLAFHRDTIPKSSGNFFSIQIGNRVLTADNATDVSDLAEKLKGDSDYNFIRDSVGLGSSKIELFDVLDIAAGTVNASGLSSINQGQSAAANGDLFKSGAVYKKRVTSGTDTFVGNVSGRSIDQDSSTATTGEIFLFSAASGGTRAVYKTKGTGSEGADETITNPASADQTLLTNALSSSRVQRLRVNFGEDSTDRASLYQSSHKATITDIESAINA